MPQQDASYIDFIADELQCLSHSTSVCLVHDRCLISPNSDIDLLVTDCSSAIKWFSARGYVQLYPAYSHLWVKFIPKINRFVVFDLANKYEFLPSADLMFLTTVINQASASTLRSQIRVLSQPHYAAYIVLKDALCRGSYKPHHVVSASKAIDELAAFGEISKLDTLYSFLPKTLSFYFINFRNAVDQERLKQFVNLVSADLGRIARTDHYSKKLLSRIHNLFCKPLTIAVIGPDGSGKTSVVDSLKELPFCRVKYMGPGQQQKDVLPLYKNLMSLLDVGRYRYSKSSFIGKLYRAFYLIVVFFDMHSRYLSQCLRVNSDYIVFFDRFPFDVYVRNQDKIRFLLFCWLQPKPDHVILLVGDPNQINARKPELSSSEIAATYSAYYSLFASLKISFSEINTTDCVPAASLSQLLSCLSALNHTSTFSN